MRDNSFTLKEFETNIITLSLGKEYLYNIAHSFLKGFNDTNDCYREIDYFVNSIADKNKINKFVLSRELYSFIHSKRLNELIKDLWLDDEEFSYSYLFYHAKNVYKQFIQDRKKAKVHLWLKFEPKEPDKYNRLDDTLPNYDSIMCKFYLHNYRKYTSDTNTSADGWTYQLCMFYLLVIGNLYRILRPYLTSVEDFITRCMLELNPIITGFTSTLDFNTKEIKALKIIYELMQLHSKGNYLQIHKNKHLNSIEFVYTTLGSTFHSALNDSEKSTYRGDNNGNRLVKLKVAGQDNILTMRIDIVGLGVLEDITGEAVQKSFYSCITEEITMEYIGYKVLKYMLSHTKEHETILNKAKTKTAKYYLSNLQHTHNLFNKEDVIDSYSRHLLYNNVFTNLKPETKLSLAEKLKNKFPIQKQGVDYIIIAIELAKYDNATISKKIKTLGSKQQAQIRKMIKYAQKLNLEPKQPVLNSIYKTVSYKD